MANRVALNKIKEEIELKEREKSFNIPKENDIDWDKYYRNKKIKRFFGIGVESEDESK